MKLSISKLAVALAVSLPVFGAANLPATTSEAALASQVRSTLLKLPYYSVFDRLTFQVNGNEVRLAGDVTKPWLKTQAENAIKGISGVESVNSQVNVLPLSNYDDRIRFAVARAVYGQPSMTKYANITAPIRIIVKNGVVTLEGSVINEGDKTIAFLQANAVPGVFHVNNALTVDRS
jgi:osmotically-inducible protein OsmY